MTSADIFPSDSNDSDRPAPVPDLDWPIDRAHALGRAALDLWENFLTELRSLPVGRAEIEADVRDAVGIAVPEAGLTDAELMTYLRLVVLNHSVYPGHPRFMGYISGAGTVPGAVADFLAAAINQNVGGWLLSPAATEIELHLIRWLAAELGLPSTAGGTLTSGGSVANLTALKVARDNRAGWDTRDVGLCQGVPLVLYASEEAHVAVDRAADVLGLGQHAVRHVAVDDIFRMRIPELRQSIAADLDAGNQPVAVVATAGTTATGAIDPLDEVASTCHEYGLWFHVDAAYGGPAALVPELRALFAGIERADSVTVDPHKWLYTPLAGGCVLLRDSSLIRDSFAVDPAYSRQDRVRTGRGTDFHNFGLTFSRSFAALKVWISLLAHGRSAYVRRIHHDVQLAQYLHARVLARPEFEAMAPVTLSIACFRYIPRDLPEDPSREKYLNTLNERLVTAIQLDGRAFCSNAILKGRYVLRACIVNFRTEAPDVDQLLDVAATLGAALDEDLRPAALR